MTDISLEVVDLEEIPEKKRKKLQKDLKSFGRERTSKIKGEKLILAKKNQEIVGFTSLLPQKNSLFIDKIRVKEKEREKGIGSKMNELVEKQAEKLDVEEIKGKVPKEKAQEFWEGRGYKIKEKGVGKAEKKKKDKGKRR